MVRGARVYGYASTHQCVPPALEPTFFDRQRDAWWLGSCTAHSGQHTVHKQGARDRIAAFDCGIASTTSLLLVRCCCCLCCCLPLVLKRIGLRPCFLPDAILRVRPLSPGSASVEREDRIWKVAKVLSNSPRSNHSGLQYNHVPHFTPQATWSALRCPKRGACACK
jgi:hypothetical protein